FQMATPGKHMAMNAGAAIAIALEAGADLESSRKALLAFRGVGRRFQIEGEFQGVTFVDDYAHLPTEIEAVVGAASGGGWNRIICVFQPHRFTRLSAIWKTYGASFRLANEVVVTELYSAGEDPIEGISSQLIVDAIKSTDPSRKVSRLEDRGDLFAYLRNELRSGDLCLVLSAGDLVNIGRKVFADYPEKAQGLA
ncbi:MAG TPA: cyanophycin synthetase, partial [Acidimicrobiales bacterium]|nr:cyanophycin synthetase [Acidimicrobiales bacterium]